VRCIADTAPRPTVPSNGGSSLRTTLRGFHPRDVERISEIVSEALHEHYEPSLYPQLGQQWPEGFLVAADPEGYPAGFLLGVNQAEGEARVLMFAVHQPWRTQGVGNTLMRAFLERCRVRGIRRVTLEVRVSNATAIRFYTRFGFSVTDLLRTYYSDGENGYQMARELP
jgi:ribosomal protein S18 acetylase RimI-like enzyme